MAKKQLFTILRPIIIYLDSLKSVRVRYARFFRQDVVHSLCHSQRW